MNMWEFFTQHSKGIGFGFFMVMMLIVFTLLAAIASRPNAEMNACAKAGRDWKVVVVSAPGKPLEIDHECIVHDLTTPAPSASVTTTQP